MIKKFTSRNTKSEILAGYNSLAKEYKSLKSQKSAGPAPARKAAPTAATDDADVSIGDIIGSLRGLTGKIGEAASMLQGKLSHEATALQGQREHADQIIAQLQSIHSIAVDDSTLDSLVEKYQATAQAADEELDAKKDAFKTKMSEAKDAWGKEQDEHKRTVKERDSNLSKARKREGQEYKYELQQARKSEEDESAQAQKVFEAELAALREAKQEEWTAREKALAERESELAELRAKAEAFPGELEDKLKRAEQEGGSIARRDTRGKAELQSKDHESAQQMLDLKISALEETLAKQETQIAALSKQLESARDQTTSLAVKAIEGASNASSFEAIKEIAMEQAKTGQKGK